MRGYKRRISLGEREGEGVKELKVEEKNLKMVVRGVGRQRE